jgi:hypothetical protein
MRYYIKSPVLALALAESTASRPNNVVVEFDVVTISVKTILELTNTLDTLNNLLEDWSAEAESFVPTGKELKLSTYTTILNP